MTSWEVLVLHPKLLLIFLAPPLFLLFSGRDWAYDVRVHSHVFGFDLSGMPGFVLRLLGGRRSGGVVWVLDAELLLQVMCFHKHSQSSQH